MRDDHEHTPNSAHNVNNVMATKSNDSHSHAVEMPAVDYRLLIQEQTLKMKTCTAKANSLYISSSDGILHYWLLGLKKKFSQYIIYNAMTMQFLSNIHRMKD